jgi:hypothetical protein
MKITLLGLLFFCGSLGLNLSAKAEVPLLNPVNVFTENQFIQSIDAKNEAISITDLGEKGSLTSNNGKYLLRVVNETPKNDRKVVVTYDGGVNFTFVTNGGRIETLYVLPSKTSLDSKRIEFTYLNDYEVLLKVYTNHSINPTRNEIVEESEVGKIVEELFNTDI